MNAFTTEVILEARDIVKRHPGTIALDSVTMRLHRNQVSPVLAIEAGEWQTVSNICAHLHLQGSFFAEPHSNAMGWARGVAALKE